MSDTCLPVNLLRPATPASTDSLLYVFLGAKVGNIVRIYQIALDGSGSADFFDTLRKEYLNQRGILRNMFSDWRFSDCDFCRVCRLELSVIDVIRVSDPGFSLKELATLDTYSTYGTRSLRLTIKNTTIRQGQWIVCPPSPHFNSIEASIEEARLLIKTRCFKAFQREYHLLTKAVMHDGSSSDYMLVKRFRSQVLSVTIYHS